MNQHVKFDPDIEKAPLQRLFEYHTQANIQTALNDEFEEISVVSPQFERMFIARAERSFGKSSKDSSALYWLSRKG